MNKHKGGFTIVELLIVIVVIAVLAAISVVSYTGIQQRAANTQTLSALQSWVKAMNMYRVDEGKMPPGWVCLGTDYPYGESGTDTTGAQCRKDSNTDFTTSDSFNNSLKPYIGEALPTPSMTTVSRPDGSWRRGLMYAATGGNGNLSYILAANKGDVTCPSVSGTESVSKQTWGSDTLCQYIVEER